MAKKVQLIIGSTRENRLGEDIATWVEEQVAKNSMVELEIVDLKKVNLPAFNAPIPPAYAPTTTAEGKVWAEKIGKADGFIFLTPEYNRSIPASLKNAIDYLATEWKEKPAVVVSYGYIDGGLGANRHLNDVLDWLKVATAETTVGIHLKQDMLNDSGKLTNPDEAFAEYEETLRAALQQFDDAKEPELVTS